MSSAAVKWSEKEESLSGRWKKLEAALKDIQPLSKDISRVEKLLDENNSLKSKLRSAEHQLGNHNEQLARVTKIFEEKCHEWHEKNDRLRTKLDDLNAAHHQASARANATFEQRLRSVRGDLRCKTEELDNATMSLAGAKEQLKESHLEVEKMNNEIGWEQLDESIIEAFQALSSSLKDLATKYFLTEIPEENDVDHIYHQLRDSHLMDELYQPIPISNTIVSQHLRVAAAENIISVRMTDKVFTSTDPCTLPNGRIVKDALRHLHQVDIRQEAMLRTLFTSGSEKEIKVNTQTVIQSTVDEITSLFLPLLWHEASRRGFRVDLEHFLSQAGCLWGQVMKLKVRVGANCKPKDIGFDIEYEDLIESPVGKSNGTRIQGPVMVLFPRIYLYSDDEPIHPGYALWFDQDIFVAGIMEAQNQILRTKAGKDDRRQSFYSSPSSRRHLRRSAGSISERSQTQDQDQVSKAGQNVVSNSSM